MTTFHARKATQVIKFEETHCLITIDYLFKGKPKTLIVDKVENVDLMELIDGDVCQFDAIILAAQHEVNMSTTKYLDITKPDSLFELMADITRTHAKAMYGINVNI